MSEVFTIRRQVEFNHCDPAGIVFYPRYFEMISALVERFFADGMCFGWAEMGRTDGGMGTPMGDIHVRFQNPSRLEDWLDLSLAVKRLGRASVSFDITCVCKSQARFNCEATVVYASLVGAKAAPWPDALRADMIRYLTPSETQQTPL
ncbi:hypothetical protein P775_13100 [Puniceibacterium antarcticum]|uniref:Thioesterase domain-containing protein n=1 Tax=Puniceibacterium antarcticum TaxID=1206336 RepID=A0A2G8RDV3_9RHOB|nr:thioesterase family protein [Puniceibacterium antarcticum]PIL19739.1 hypothetical protein P775_13100 [Puniceibacterium antarcticum]